MAKIRAIPGKASVKKLRAHWVHVYVGLNDLTYKHSQCAHLQHASLATRFERLLGVVEEGLEVAEAERHAAHDALSRVACQEHVVGVVRQADQNRQFCLSEVLRLVHKHLDKEWTDVDTLDNSHSVIYLFIQG